MTEDAKWETTQIYDGQMLQQRGKDERVVPLVTVTLPDLDQAHRDGWAKHVKGGKP